MAAASTHLQFDVVIAECRSVGYTQGLPAPAAKSRGAGIHYWLFDKWSRLRPLVIAVLHTAMFSDCTSTCSRSNSYCTHGAF
jgi:hypothetical protein